MKLPEGLPLDEGFVSQMQKVAWEAGIPQDAWSQLFEAFTGYQVEAVQSITQAQAEQAQKTAEALRSEWGQAYGAKVAEAEEAFRHVFGSQAEEVAQLTLQDGTVLGNHPAVLRAFADLAGQMGEGQSLSGMQPKPRTLSPQEAQKELNHLMADEGFLKAWTDPQHPEHQDAVEKRASLFAMIHGQGPAGQDVGVGGSGITGSATVGRVR